MFWEIAMIKVRLYRYHPEQDDRPRMETREVEERFRKAMVLDVLEHLKQQDATLAYRRSCREGVCGSDGMNINGKNGLACITPVAEALGRGDTLILRPLPGMAGDS
jgi:succinate dehydrogenase / fumarate reductase, iron-sulfur subunit